MLVGAFAVYLEPWHADIFDFLDLRKNHGKVCISYISYMMCLLCGKYTNCFSGVIFLNAFQVFGCMSILIMCNYYIAGREQSS